LATADRRRRSEVEADCCIYCRVHKGRGQTRDGLTEEELVDDVVARSGRARNIVTTCTIFLQGESPRLSGRTADRVLELREG